MRLRELPFVDTRSIFGRFRLEGDPYRARVAVFSIGFTIDDMLVRGKYLGTDRMVGVNAREVKVSRVYNPMPPSKGKSIHQ